MQEERSVSNAVGRGIERRRRRRRRKRRTFFMIPAFLLLNVICLLLLSWMNSILIFLLPDFGSALPPLAANTVKSINQPSPTQQRRQADSRISSSSSSSPSPCSISNPATAPPPPPPPPPPTPGAPSSVPGSMAPDAPGSKKTPSRRRGGDRRYWASTAFATRWWWMRLGSMAMMVPGRVAVGLGLGRRGLGLRIGLVGCCMTWLERSMGG